MPTPKSSRPSPSAAETPRGDDLRCDVCGALAYETRCKIVCSRCGYTRDCSDS